MIWSFILKKIYSFLILNKFSSLCILRSENYFRLSNSWSTSWGLKWFLNLSIKFSHLFVSSRIFISLVSFYFLKISIVLVDSPCKKVEALTRSSSPLFLSSIVNLLILDSVSGLRAVLEIFPSSSLAFVSSLKLKLRLELLPILLVELVGLWSFLLFY